jgi:hypothetical protein
MLDAEKQKIAAKILKLIALADGTTFAAEAEAARRMAADLRAAYGIAAGAGASKDRTVIEVRKYTPFAKGARWEAIIAGALADLCGCAMFFGDVYRTDYRKPEGGIRLTTNADLALVGAISDLDMLFFMLPELHRQRIVAWTDYRISGSDSFHKFCYGFAKALNARISQLTEKWHESDQRKQLVAWFEAYLGHKLKNADILGGRASSEAGTEAGRTASLHRGTLGGERQKMLR